MDYSFLRVKGQFRVMDDSKILNVNDGINANSVY